MHSPVSIISSYCLNSLWLTPLLWMAGCVACWIVRRLGPNTTHRIWVLVLFAAVGVPSIPIGLAALHPPAAKAPWSVGSAFHVGAKLSSTWSEDPPLALLPHSLLTLLSFTYLGLLIVFCGRFTRSVLLTSRLVRRARLRTLAPPFERICQEMAHKFRVDPQLLESDDLSGPVTVGFRLPVLLLPSGFIDATELDDFRVAVAHECVHLARHDFLKNLCYETLSLPIAFHPFSWLIKKQIAQSRELLCDQVAVQQTVDARVYVRSLLRLAMRVASGPQPATLTTIGINDANILEKRVMELRTPKPKAATGLRFCLLPASGMLLAAATLAGVAAPIVSTGLETAHTGESQRVFHVGKDVSAPVLVRQADPEFPAAYKKRDGTMSGDCKVAFIVDRSGVPRKVHVVQSFNELFDKEAVKAVKQYRFKPGMHLGNPVPVDLLVDVNFQQF